MIDAPREVHLAIIRKQFPGITRDDMTLDAGGDHHVYIVDESVIFRFPQVPRRIAPVREHAIDWLAASGAVPFALPGCEIHHDPEFNIWFERVDYIPGASFTPAVAATFTHDAMMVIARQMAAFLNAVHALPIGPARELGMDEMDPTDFWDYMESNPGAYPWVRRTLWPIVTAAERAWIEHLFEGFIAQVRHTPMPLAICHNDMFPYHIIVNTMTQRISGVIDFRWRITDPAGDFKAFEYYGRTFLDSPLAADLFVDLGIQTSDLIRCHPLAKVNGVTHVPNIRDSVFVRSSGDSPYGSKGISMFLSTMMYVSDMTRSVAFYELLGCVRSNTGEMNEHVNELMVGDGRLGLQANGEGPLPDVGSRAYLILVVPADGSLDRIHQACKEHGVEFGFDTRDDGFGRSFLVNDPDGYPVTLNERA